jgi:arylsulfatase A-like enzyme
MQAKDVDLERFKHITDLKRRLAVAMAYNLDANIGRILDALRRHDLEANTLVVS